MSKLQDLIEKIEQRFSETADMFVQHDQLTLEVDPSDLLLCGKILRDEPEFKFEQLMDVCGVDFLDYGLGEWATDTATTEGFSRATSPIAARRSSAPFEGGEDTPVSEGLLHTKVRFATVYQLLSLTHNHRIRLRVYCRGEPPTVPSVTKIWPSANWYEREAFDLFGIHFSDHPDLRRILTDYNFSGHPFRKDFPLIGHVEMRYDAAQAKCIYEPVSIEPRILVPKVIRHVEPKGEPHG